MSPNYARHHIGSPEADPIILCDEHFRQVNEAGMVKEPYLEPHEYERREQKRVGERTKGHRLVPGELTGPKWPSASVAPRQMRM